MSVEAVEWWRGYEKLSKEFEEAANRDPAFASNPGWFGWDGEHVRISQTKVRQRCRNMNREPQIALSLGMDKYPNHQPGDERVVILVCLEHTTRIGG